MKKKIALIGCGWLGSRIAAFLQENYDILTTTTSPDKLPQLTSKGFAPTLIDFTADCAAHPDFEAAEVAIITIPLSGARIDREKAENIINNIAIFLGNFKGQVFFTSSTSVYPTPARTYTEEDVSRTEIAGEAAISEKFLNVNILRLGGLMGDNRLLKRYAPKNLNEPVNHIHYLDVCRVIAQMIDNKTSGQLYNVVAPRHPTKHAVINKQNSHTIEATPDGAGRIISSIKLIRELQYEFKYPDPLEFHLTPTA